MREKKNPTIFILFPLTLCQEILFSNFTALSGKYTKVKKRKISKHFYIKLKTFCIGIFFFSFYPVNCCLKSADQKQVPLKHCINRKNCLYNCSQPNCLFRKTDISRCILKNLNEKEWCSVYFLLSKSITKQSRKGFQCAVHEVPTGTECERKARTKENLQKYKKKKMKIDCFAFSRTH